MRELTRNEILTAADLTLEAVEVPEWGGRVYVRPLTAGERDAFDASIYVVEGGTVRVRFEQRRARLAAWTLVTSDGQRLFSDADVDVLAGKSAAALERVYLVALRLNGMAPESAEHALGNSGGARSSGRSLSSLDS